MKRLLPLALTFALALSGCTPAASSPSGAPGETPSPAPTATPRPGPAVYTDASQLTPYEKPEPPVSKFTRRYEEFTDALIPSGDYGILIPFPGASAVRAEDTGWGWWGTYELYGLMTLDGEVVVDPVFSSAYAPSHWDERSGQNRELDCLILQKVVKDENGELISVAALCARDGSWCTDFDYVYDWEMFWDLGDEAVPFLCRNNGDPDFPYDAVVFLDPHTGETVKTVDLAPALAVLGKRSQFSPYQLLRTLSKGERYILSSDNTKRYLYDTETGATLALEETLGAIVTNSSSFSEGLCPVKVSSGWGYIDGTGHWVIDPVYEEAGEFEDGHALVRDEEEGGNYKYIDHRGKVIYAFPDGVQWPTHFDEFLSYETMGRRYFLDEDFHPLSLPEDFTNPFKQGDWFIQELPDPSPTVPGGTAFWNYKTGARQDFSGEWEFSRSVAEGRAILNGCADKSLFALADLTTGELTDLGHWSIAYFTQDELTGEDYLYLERYGEEGDPVSEWRRLNGDILYRIEGPHAGYISLWGDRAMTSGDAAVTLTDLKTGELLFSWPLRPLED